MNKEFFCAIWLFFCVTIFSSCNLAKHNSNLSINKKQKTPSIETVVDVVNKEQEVYAILAKKHAVIFNYLHLYFFISSIIASLFFSERAKVAKDIKEGRRKKTISGVFFNLIPFFIHFITSIFISVSIIYTHIYFSILLYRSIEGKSFFSAFKDVFSFHGKIWHMLNFSIIIFFSIYTIPLIYKNFVNALISVFALYYGIKINPKKKL